MVAKDEVAMVEEVDSTHLRKGTQTFDKKMEAIEESSKEGGAYMPNKVSKRGPLLVMIVGSSAAVKRSAESEEESWLPQADNSQTTPTTPTLNITIDCSS